MKQNSWKYCTLTGILALVSSCQTLPVERAAVEASHKPKVEFSDEGLQNIQAMMETAVADGRIPAAISMLARDGEIIWLKTAGDMGPGVPMRRDAIFPLASVGKMFTATAAMILVERGVISFDDPVSQYIPEFADIMISVADDDGDAGRENTLVAPIRPITVYHLLTHTSGLTINGDDFWAAWDANVGKTTTAHLARDLAALPLQSQPGTQFDYGPTGAAYEVLGAVIEKASGQTLEAFMTKNIFEPLGLNDNSFYVPADKSHRLPAFFSRTEDGTLEIARAYGEDFSRSTFFHGGGGVRSTPEDIVRFTRLFTEGGSIDGVRILKASTIDQMMSDQLGELAPDRWKSIGLSWGFGAVVRGASAVAAASPPDQYGWVGGGYVKLWIDPKQNVVAFFAFPMEPPGDNNLLREFDRLVYAAMSEAQP